MTLTEEEAKTKWCPFSRVSMMINSQQPNDFSYHPITVNRGGLGTNCMASDCMLWRWEFIDRGYCSLGRER